MHFKCDFATCNDNLHELQLLSRLEYFLSKAMVKSVHAVVSAHNRATYLNVAFQHTTMFAIWWIGMVYIPFTKIIRRIKRPDEHKQNLQCVK